MPYQTIINLYLPGLCCDSATSINKLETRRLKMRFTTEGSDE